MIASGHAQLRWANHCLGELLFSEVRRVKIICGQLFVLVVAAKPDADRFNVARLAGAKKLRPDRHMNSERRKHNFGQTVLCSLHRR